MADTASPRRGLDGGMPPEDWDLLFGAVLLRLRHCVSEPAALPHQPAVQDCVQSLELLSAALLQERGYLRRIEAQLQETCVALAAARAELVRTQVQEQRARHLSQHDSLTELPNRNQFRRRLDDALSTGNVHPPALAVLYLDLDDFKPINDLHGHDTGDQLLRIIAQRLSRAVRQGDVVCRIGGDEFACLLPQAMGHAQLSRLASQLFDAVSAPLKVGTLELSVRPSIGIAVCPTDGDTTSALLQRADAAMYHAKRHQLGYAFAGGTVGA